MINQLGLQNINDIPSRIANTNEIMCKQLTKDAVDGFIFILNFLLIEMSLGNWKLDAEWHHKTGLKDFHKITIINNDV